MCHTRHLIRLLPVLGLVILPWASGQVPESKVPAGRPERVSRIIGMDLVNRDGDGFGEIKDLLLATDGRIAFAFVSEKSRLIPWAALKSAGDGKKLILDCSEDRFEDSPKLDKELWGDATNPAFAAINAWFGVPPAEYRGTFARAQTLRKSAVRDGSGRKIGEVEELILDWEQGNVSLVIMDGGKEIGPGGQLVAVPWAAVSTGAHGKEIVLASSPPLSGAPRFELDSWPDFQKAYVISVHTWFKQHEHAEPVVVRATGLDTEPARGVRIYVCTHHPEIRLTAPGECTVCRMQLVERSAPDPAPEEVTQQEPSATTWVCLSHPDVRLTASGECPKCRLRLLQIDNSGIVVSETYRTYLCPEHTEVHLQTAGQCPTCQAALVERVVTTGEKLKVYTCPAHVEIRRAVTGRCPSCRTILVETALPVRETRIVTQRPEAGATTWVCLSHPDIKLTASGECPKCRLRLLEIDNSGTVVSETYRTYLCPVHTEVHLQSAGQCPTCNAALIERVVTTGEKLKFYTCPTHVEVRRPVTGPCPACKAALIERPVVVRTTIRRYTCPSHLEILQEAPGACPHCKVQLILKDG